MIIGFEDKYSDEVKELLKSNPYYFSYGEKAEKSIVALESNKLIGIGSLWKNTMHPNREYIGIYISPDYRNKGIGGKMYDDLYASSPTKKLQTSISSKDTVAISFLSKFEFHLARKCYTPILREALFDINSEPRGKITSFNGLTNQQKEELLAIQMKIYREFHKHINPLSESISDQTWKDIVLDNIDEENSFLLLREEKIEAYILSYHGENEKEIDIGYIGGKNLLQLDEYLPFYKRAVNKLLERFANVSIEADDVDPFASAVLNLFPYDKSDSWDAYTID
ncbi:GNAT family N-acetyltransferase [Jeotgalibaca caeni]|uniref:GNAT family N-acetyltransferase n=1 Tax=Jeotgalibaca caeni TaxID=3028623 RepID=UPI00237D490A|nr:GNAT family N-acetyltransferase [Jeotgalibaca caeni]MDE1549495.1 GNAT family N-acetyltransferase [Jeotgalibaca caeni]